MTAATTDHPATVTRRPATPADDGLLRALFADSREDLRLLPEPLVEMQQRAQAAQIAADHPDATRDVIVADGVDAGALVLATDAASVTVVDIVVARTHRKRGIAEAVLADVITAAGDRPVLLTVWSENTAARRLYQKLGFVATADTEGHIPMQRPAGSIDRPAGRRP